MGREVSVLFCEFPKGKVLFQDASFHRGSSHKPMTPLCFFVQSVMGICTPLHQTPTGFPILHTRSQSAHQREGIQTGDEIKHGATLVGERSLYCTSQYILYIVLVSIYVIVHPSGFYRRGAPAGLVNVIGDKTALCGAARDVLVVLKLTVCGCHTKCSVNFSAHVLQVSSRLVGAFMTILTFWSYWMHPLSWHGIDFILFFSPSKTQSQSILYGRVHRQNIMKL